MSAFDWTNPTVVRLLDRYTTLNRKATPQDAEQSRVVREVAQYYAANYEGDFTFMVKMRGVMDTWNSLTVAQASGTINCLLAEYRKRQQAPAVKPFVYPTAELPNLPAEIAAHKLQEAAPAMNPQPQVSIRAVPIRATCGLCGALADVAYDTSLTASCIDKAACAARRNTPVVAACKSGIYTIVLDETGNYRTLKLSDVPAEKCVNDIPVGSQYVGFLSGPNNDSDYTPMGYVCGTELRIKTQYRRDSNIVKALTVLLSADRETQIDYGHAYAIESGSCFICGRTLTVPASLHRGMGPICAEKY